MIVVVIERQAKKDVSLLTLLRQIRVEAMKQPGYISGQTLVGTEDRSDIVVVSTWQSLKDWKVWEASEQRAKLERQIEALLVAPAKVRTYRYLSYKRAVGEG